MNDPLDDLKRAFERATPEPDASRRREILDRAMELFDGASDRASDRGGESAAESSRVADRGYAAYTGNGSRNGLGRFRRRFRQGVRQTLATRVPRAALAAAAGLAAVGLAFLFVFVSRETTSRPKLEELEIAEVAAASTPAPATPAASGQEPAPVGPPTEVPVTDRFERSAEPHAQRAEPAVAQIAAGRPVSESVELESGTRRFTAVAQLPGRAARSGDEEVSEPCPECLVVSTEPGTDGEDGEEVDVAEAGRVAAFAKPKMPAPEPVPESDTASARVGTLVGTLEVDPRTARLQSSVEAEVRSQVSSKARLARGVRAWPASLPTGSNDARRDAWGGDCSATSAAGCHANEPASPTRTVRDEPVSTFSIDVDTASYSMVRSSLMNGYLPPPDAVRIEEMVNHFPYAYPAPGERGAPFRPTVTVSETPWNPDTLLMHIGIQGRKPQAEDRPPLNLVFLIDTSGSMNQPNKLPLLAHAFRLMLGQLDPADEVAIVTYSSSASLALDATASSDRATILAAIDRLHASGSTAGAAGIQLAYETARDMAVDGEITRVVLATDGDFNVGISDPEQLERFIAGQRDGGVYLSVLGFGRDNLNDATMQALAQNGNGQAAYIDTLAEAQKVLVDQLVGTLFPIADDVKIQVEFNPAAVAEYRLIGYETRALRREDFNNDRVDAGEIGAGHSVTAIYEVTPVGSPAVLHDALRYAERTAEPPGATSERNAGELAFLRLRYKEPGEDASRLIELPIARDAGSGGSDQRFAAAVAGFGQLLRRGVHTGSWSFADAIALAEANTGDDRFGYRREAVTLMRLAESLAE